MRSIVRRVVVLLCVFTFVLPVFGRDATQRASAPSVTANEATARLKLRENGSVFSIELAVNSSEHERATLVAKIVSPDEKLLAEGSAELTLSSVPKRVEVAVPWAPGSKDGLQDAANARLMYEVRVENNPEATVKGTLSPYALIPDLFELRFIGLQAISPGRAYTARVWATRPDSDQPVPGVELSAWLGDANEEDTAAALKAHGRTNLHGEGLLTFRIPPKSENFEDERTIDIEIHGKHGGFQNNVTGSLQISSRAAILLSMDKPLYQPEQTLHMRALILDDQHHAWAKLPVRFVVKDPDETTVFSGDANSSHFGIASADWVIPASQKMGDYQISLEIGADSSTTGDTPVAFQSVRITRYELPTFTVNAATNQPYYLPGQNAELTVSASYLFGKPVLRGHVKVVREDSRHWNYREQKWEGEEAVAAEGELDAKNEFHATLDLAKDHADLRESDWKRFEDVRYAAYLTDASSGRTQERRFDVRLSHDAIHLYVVSPRSAPVGLPVKFFVSASTADGMPAAAHVTVSLWHEDPSEKEPFEPSAKPFATAHVHTNRFGIARVTMPPIAMKEKDQNGIYIALDARTLDGRTGKHSESYDVSEGLALRVTAMKPVFQPGEAIEMDVEASKPGTRTRIEVMDTKTQALVAWQEIVASPRASRVTFAPDERFSGLLVIAAYPVDMKFESRYDWYASTAAASVVFPHPDKLQLDVKPVKTEYRPGEGATLNVQVRGPQGEAAPGALGVLVYDQALEELARTEARQSVSESVDARLGFRDFDDSRDSLGGVRVKDLLNWKPGEPMTRDQELVAEALLFNTSWFPISGEDSDKPQNLDSVFARQINGMLAKASTVLQDHFNSSGHFPANDSEYTEILKAAGLDAAQLTDPWGRPYRIQRSYQYLSEVLEFRSDGPDKKHKTADDFTALRLMRPFFEHDAKILRGILDSYHVRTGGYIRDRATLETACKDAGTPLAQFVDPWGTPYRFEFGMVRDSYTVTVTSAGPDKHFRADSGRERYDYDDLQVSVLNTPYFLEASQRISDALFDSAKKSAHFPENEQEFSKVMQEHGIDWSALRDPWDRPYHVVAGVESSYSDKITFRAYGQNTTSSLTPVTHTVKVLRIVSDGPDMQPNTPDDFTLARFASPFFEESGGKAGSSTAEVQKPIPVYRGNNGAVQVVVKDVSGALVPNAKVTLTNEGTSIEYTGATGEEGSCLLANLSPGKYRILVEMLGFHSYVMTGITQATVNVLQSLVRQLGADSAGEQASKKPLRIEVDGKPRPELPASADARQLTPLRADLTACLGPGKHRVEIHGGPSTHASAYVNMTYYLPWNDPEVIGNTVRSGDAESLRYSVQFDHTAAKTGEPIHCTVHAERVGFHGYGMMLAEVGLPPGADVDRASLDAALSLTWDVQSYEIQPDRVVLYLWPRAGGTTFSFALKPRFAMTAQSAESILYDYYNPEARASVPPARFEVQ